MLIIERVNYRLGAAIDHIVYHKYEKALQPSK